MQEPTIEDIELIAQCKVERQRMAAQIKVLKAISRFKHKDEIAKLIAQRKQLSDEMLAKKFEVSRYQIGLIEP